VIAEGKAAAAAVLVFGLVVVVVVVGKRACLDVGSLVAMGKAVGPVDEGGGVALFFVSLLFSQPDFCVKRTVSLVYYT
jgi:hypothetical protein